MNQAAQENIPFSEKDLEQLVKLIAPKEVHFQRGTKRVLVQMAQVFLQQILDLPPSQKQNLKIESINKQIASKFPEISQQHKLHTVDHLQKRTEYIQKEQS